MATITPTITATQIYTASGGTTTNYSGYVGYGGASNQLYSCRLAFIPSKNCTKIVLGISGLAVGYGTSSSRVNFRAAVYTSLKYPTSVNWEGDRPSVGSIQSFAMSTQTTAGGRTTGSVTITGAFTAGTTYYLLVWHYTSHEEYFTNATWTLTGTVTSYTITFNANGGSAAPSRQTKDYGSSVTLTSSKPTAPATTTDATYVVTLNYNGNGTANQSNTCYKKTSATFSKWNTKSDGSGTDYNPGATYSANASVTLYAIWTYTTTTDKVTLPTPTRANSIDQPYTITYNYNGSGASNTTVKPNRIATWAFSRWNTKSDNTGSGYSGGTDYTPTATVTLYAIWTPTYSVAAVTLLSATRSGYELLGWGDSASSTTGLRQPGSTYTASGNKTFYAIWKALGLVRIYSNGSWKTYQCYVYTGSQWKMCAPYIYNNSKWNLCV